MNSEQLQKWALGAEIFGGIAVVATLIILVLQIRDNTNAIRIQTMGDARERIEEAYQYKMNNSAVYAKSLYEPQNLTREEIVEVAYLYTIHESVLLTFYDAYKSGAISEEDWNRWVNSAPGLIGDPISRSVWEISKPLMDSRDRAEFVLAIDGAMEKDSTGGDHTWIKDIQELVESKFN